MSYTLEQRLEYARGQAINDQDKEAIQLAIDKIKELEAENKNTREQHIEGVKIHAEFFNEVYEPLKAENAQLKESISYCSGSCKSLFDLTQSIGIDDE